MAAFAEERIRKLPIDGAYLVDLEIHVDSRGLVYEIIHESDAFVDRIRQVYQIHDPRADTIRAFHAHRVLHDWFHIARGSAIFCLVDSRLDGATRDAAVRLVLTDRKPQLLVVPPGVYHGWMSLQPDTILTSIASDEYDRVNPDEDRVSPYHFNQLFGRNPWEMDAR